MIRKLGKRKCDWCKNEFQKTRSIQPACSFDCLIKLSKEKVKKDRAKLEREEIKELKSNLLTRSDWLKLLQTVFNTFIRERDKNQPCISCGCKMEGRKGDASHYYSVGNHSGVRFNEDNVHLSCVPCNQHLHGNIAEYSIRLPVKIGLERFSYLEKIRHCEMRLTIPEIQEQIKIYKDKIKSLR